MYELKKIPTDFYVEEVPEFELRDSGEFSIYLLEKESANTEEVVRLISNRFKLPRKFFGYAGNKDKHAVTKQYISVKGKIPDYSENNFKLSFFGYSSKAVSVGNLIGNKFRIVARGISEPPHPETEFINYFDDQRFGRNNLEIGIALIKKDFKSAGLLCDLPEVKERLSKVPGDFVNALRLVPFKILSIYIHSVQSYIFNEIVAEICQENDCCEVAYEKGVFAFPKAKIANLIIPLISFDTELSGKIGQTAQKVLDRLGISKRDFVIRQIPGITPLGGERELVADIKHLKIGIMEKDDLGPLRKIQLEFELGKGSYATVAVRRMFAHN
ncbi:MAG: tRNA pseudouridine(13) synthase TruD [archaeon]